MNYSEQTFLRARGIQKRKIAEASGLSYATVVNALNGKTKPMSETLDRINAAIDILEGK